MNLDYLVKGYNIAGEGFGGMDNNCFGVSLVSTIGPAIALAARRQEVVRARRSRFGRGADPAHDAADVLSWRAGRPARWWALPHSSSCPSDRSTSARCSSSICLQHTFDRTAADGALCHGGCRRGGRATRRPRAGSTCGWIAESHAASKPIFGVGPGNFPVVAESLGWSARKAGAQHVDADGGGEWRAGRCAPLFFFRHYAA